MDQSQPDLVFLSSLQMQNCFRIVKVLMFHVESICDYVMLMLENTSQLSDVSAFGAGAEDFQCDGFDDKL